MRPADALAAPRIGPARAAAALDPAWAPRRRHAAAGAPRARAPRAGLWKTYLGFSSVVFAWTQQPAEATRPQAPIDQTDFADTVAGWQSV
jgi:hypothetical protein